MEKSPKNYSRIRLEYNEGKIRSEELRKQRYAWRESVKDLPSKEFPSSRQLGYNKHYYEVELLDGRIFKFRKDVSVRENSSFTEQEVRDWIREELKAEKENAK